MNNNTINFDETLPPSGSRRDEANGLKPGTMLGQYRVVRLLGRGGMGEVYEVEHTTLRRRYALKLLPADFANRAGALERFKREAEVMANLEHPNIVKVDDFGETDGRYWLRMELASGFVFVPEPGGRVSPRAGADGALRSLADYAEAQGGRLDPDEAAAIFKQILTGLAHAHEHGVIHRDLKPANILLFSPDTDNQTDETPVCKISDFGLVRMIGEEWLQSRTEESIRLSMSVGGMQTEVPEGAGSSTRSLIGTYEYMSPEQKRGEEAIAASDVYSVGLMMYRLLTGRQLGMKRPSEIVPDLSPEWDSFIMKAIDDTPTDRFTDASDMKSGFSTGPHSAPISAGPTQVAAKTPKTRPNPRIGDTRVIGTPDAESVITELAGPVTIHHDPNFADWQRAESAFHSGMHSEAIKLYKAMSANRLPEAMIRLGECYWNGWGCKEDKEHAERCFQAAARLKCAQAHVKLAWVEAFKRNGRKSIRQHLSQCGKIKPSLLKEYCNPLVIVVKSGVVFPFSLFLLAVGVTACLWSFVVGIALIALGFLFARVGWNHLFSNKWLAKQASKNLARPAKAYCPPERG